MHFKQFYERNKKKKKKKYSANQRFKSCNSFKLCKKSCMFYINLHTTHTHIQIPHSHKTDHSPHTQAFSHIQESYLVICTFTLISSPLETVRTWCQPLSSLLILGNTVQILIVSLHFKRACSTMESH